MSWCGYYWTLAECEARELPSDREPTKLLLWSGRKKNNKADKWGKGMHWFWVEVFREGRLDFFVP